MKKFTTNGARAGFIAQFIALVIAPAGILFGMAGVLAGCTAASSSEDLALTLATKKLTNGSKTYWMVNTPMTWSDAAEAAVKKLNGKLVEIDNQAEQTFLFSKLAEMQQFFTAATPVADGGGAKYAWIGATDHAAEGQWYWDGADTNSTATANKFGQGQVDNSGATAGTWQTESGKFEAWGDPNGAGQAEPDDYLGDQDYGAFGLEDWPNGDAGQWNDLNGDNKLPFIVEIN